MALQRCKHYQKQYNTANAKVIELEKKLTECIQEINGSTELENSYEELYNMLYDFAEYARVYAVSLSYVGKNLKRVIVNDLPFDKNQCEAASRAIEESGKNIEKLMKELDNLKDKVEKSLTELEELQKDLNEQIKVAKEERDKVPEGNCPKCELNPGTTSSSTGGSSNSSGGSSGGGGCFVAGTKVFTNKGLKNIEDIKINDVVLTLSKEETLEFNKVIKTFIHENVKEDLYSLKVGTETIKVTQAHLIYARKNNENEFKWLAASKLSAEDELLLSNKEVIKIESISKEKCNEKVYNIHVENNHNYFVSTVGVLVHNRKAVPETK